MSVEKRLIQKLFSNQCSQEELELLFDLIESNHSTVAPEVMTALLEQMDDVPPVSADISDRIFEKVKTHTTGKVSSGKKKERAVRNRKYFLFTTAVAATFVILATAWFVFHDANQSVLIKTGLAQQESIHLPDGSMVELNANSSLTFKNNWDQQEVRQVWLEGEAFFEVEKNKSIDQKFQVITKDLTIEVLGTVFNVNSHREQTKVFLQEGEVNLNLIGLEKSMLMAPGEIVEYSRDQQDLPEKRLVQRTQHTSWKYGLLIFDNAPLSEVLDKIEDIYGVSIQIRDSTHRSRKLTTGLPIDNLDEAISLLKLTLGLDIVQEDGNYFIQ